MGPSRFSCARASAARTGRPRRLNLALHGTFTWGVLDALLEDDRLAYEGLSGSSAGAMNAVVMTQGQNDGSMDLSPASKLLATLTDYFPPWQLNPLDLNPLRDLLLAQVDFERLRANSPFKLFVGATHANTGKLRVFREHELSVEVLLASACLPNMQRSIAIEGQPYWDGGYSANPAVFPLGGLERRLHQMRFHMVDTSDVASLRRSATRLLAYGPFLAQLHQQGRERGQAWLDTCLESVGHRSTVDVERHFG
jgi:hypothetical protein